MSEARAVLLDVQDGIATVTINRPEARNALNTEVWIGLRDAAAAVQENPDVRAAVLTGAGDQAFSAGLDLKATAQGAVDSGQPRRPGYERLAAMRDTFSAFEALPVPVIAAVSGYCLGGGMELICCCDIRLAGENAVFGLPEVPLGIVPDMGSTQRLPRLIGWGMAKELVYTGRRVAADEALRIGLVNHVYPAGRVLAEARAMAETIADHNPVAVANAKRALNAALSLPLPLGLQFETALAIGGLGGSGFQDSAARFQRSKSSPS